jgi:plasmid stabilization system protein ParE
VKRFAVVITKPARDNLDEIEDFLTRDWPDYADRLLLKIREAIDSLHHSPYVHVQVGISRRRRLPVHRMVVGDYLVYYRVEMDSVFVLMIRHGKQRPPKRFD